MNMQNNINQTSIAVLLILCVSPVMSDSHWQQSSAQTNVYGARSQEPTCCYSQSRLWQNTNTQSGWSVNRKNFDPNGFPQRSDYRPLRPEPLPRDTAQRNPWSVNSPGFAGKRDRAQRPNRQWSNAQYFQPAYYNYPPPVAMDRGGGWESDLMLLGIGAQGDPYFNGPSYPGYGHGLAPFGGPYGPGYPPGMW